MLDNATLLSLVGIIAKEWCKWFPALTFILLQPLWIWILDIG